MLCLTCTEYIVLKIGYMGIVVQVVIANTYAWIIFLFFLVFHKMPYFPCLSSFGFVTCHRFILKLKIVVACLTKAV